jgi:hypothetical protein
VVQNAKAGRDPGHTRDQAEAKGVNGHVVRAPAANRELRNRRQARKGQ